jgi:hypothetical protein
MRWNLAKRAEQIRDIGHSPEINALMDRLQQVANSVQTDPTPQSISSRQSALDAAVDGLRDVQGQPEGLSSFMELLRFQGVMKTLAENKR